MVNKLINVSMRGIVKLKHFLNMNYKKNTCYVLRDFCWTAIPSLGLGHESLLLADEEM